MINKIKLSPSKMTKDIAKSKFPEEMYFDAKNIRILAVDNQTTMSVINEYGNEKVFYIPSPIVNPINKRIEYVGLDGVLRGMNYSTKTNTFPRAEIEETYLVNENTPSVSGEQKIIGKAYSRDNLILFTTDDNGFDCIWEVMNVSNQGQLYLELKYMRNLGFSTENLIQAIYNYENQALEKLYWVDGVHQLRFINLRQSTANKDPEELIDMNASVVDSVGEFSPSQPTITSITQGGSHTAGVIQYAYNLYRINGAQTVISPLSELIDLGKVNKGGDLNEVVSSMPTVSIKKIDKNYTHIKLYAIKYTSFNQSPEISIIADNEITNYNEFIFTDNGSTTSTISASEFLFLGSSIVIPKHIETKNLRMFMFNLKEKKFDINLDMRAYGHNSNGEAVVWSDVVSDGNGGVTTNDPTSIINLNTSTYALSDKHDSVNKDYELYKYKQNGILLGAEGLLCSIEFDSQNRNVNDTYVKTGRFLKSGEVYRFCVEFYNKSGQSSFPKWVADLKAPDGNLLGVMNSIYFRLKPEFYNQINQLPEDERPVGYRVLRSNRTELDKTIICQGFINSMIANIKATGKDTDKSLIRAKVDNTNSLKMPSLQRPLVKNKVPLVGAKDLHELSFHDYSNTGFSSLGRGRDREGYSARSSKDWRAQNFQYNKMMQLFSPEITFGSPSFSNSSRLRVVGAQKESFQSNWSTEYNPVSKLNETEAKFTNGLTTDSPGVISTGIISNPSYLADKSLFGPTNSNDATAVFQINREFLSGFLSVPLGGQKEFEIYGSPEITDVGQGSTAYNGNSDYRYANSLRAMLIDDLDDSSDANRDAKIQVLGCNSYGAKCLTLMEGSDEQSSPISSRYSLEQIFTRAKLHEVTGGAGQFGPVYELGTGSNTAMICEIVQAKNHEYIGGIYGGNGIEAKLRNSYIPIGEYKEITDNEIFIKSPGDTYVSTFRIAKMTKTETELSSQDYTQVTEFVSVPLETTVNLNQRNDISINGWDNRFQPKEEEYHRYNKVYSQQNTLISNTGEGFKFKLINEFDTKVIASSKKINGEFIDSWTNFLENETRTLDGIYGPINGTCKIDDEIFVFQDTGIARLSIDPRVQTVGNDGISLELGTGQILADHKYVTTNSGTKNKWSIVKGGSGIYYYDTINKAISQVGGGLNKLTESLGFHSFMENNTSIDELSKDNPVKYTGVASGYSVIDGDVYFSFISNQSAFTIAYNEKLGAFTSFYDYIPSMYMFKGQRMITTGPEKNTGWQHFAGLRNTFYGNKFKSSITFLPAPGINSKDVSFNNAEYRMEMQDSLGNEIHNKTFTSVRLYNEHQDTGEVPLTVRDNAKRKFKDWNVIFPRAKVLGNKTRDRIRNPWTFIEFNFENEDGKKMILHDVTITTNEY